MRKPIACVAVALLTCAILPLPVHAQTGAVPGDCTLDESQTIRVLLLIDQSGSLARTDPDDQRIPGAMAVVRSYASLAERVQQVEVQVAGFGEDYAAGEWMVLDEDSLAGVLDRVEAVASVDDQNHTDYVYTLRGASEAFSTGTAGCQVLFWFTDGEHDLDEDYLTDVGLERFYFPDPVTPNNATDAEALMPALICDRGGYASQLGDAGVNSQIMLLGDESGMSQASNRVLRGMGGDPSLDCGPGNGSFSSVDDAARLPFLMACASQIGGYPLTDLAPDGGGDLTVTEQTIDGTAPYQLATEVRLITRGDGATPSLASSDLTDISENTDDATGIDEVRAEPVGTPFTVEMAEVAEVCGFVTAAAAVPSVQSVTPTLYQNEPGEFRVFADGPHGRLEGEVLTRLDVETDTGRVSGPDDDRWTLEVPTLPATGEVTLDVTIQSGPGLTATTPASFALNEPSNAPEILGQPAPYSGEGTGPFLIDLQVDPGDGGELCLARDVWEMTGAEGETITATADLEGSTCVQLAAGGTETVTMAVDLDRSGFAHEVLEFPTRSTASDLPERNVEGLLSLDFQVTPRANPVLVGTIVLCLMLLMLALLWAIVYGVNRLIGRIPDPRWNRVRYADFVAAMSLNEHREVEIGIAETPVDTDFHTPRRTPARLDAGRLEVERRVSVLPWVAPHARFGMGTELIGAHLGPGLPGRIVFTETAFQGRAREALGPLVAIGMSETQMEHLAEGTPQKVPGVLLFDIRAARGVDASRYAAETVAGSLDFIAAEISTRRLVDEMERSGDT